MRALKRAALRIARGYIVSRLRSSKPTLYLTFDDGPHPVHTPVLLDLFTRLGVRVSFFMVGKSAEEHPQIVAAIVAAGHTLGNHSFSHKKRRTMTSAIARSDIARTDSVLARFDGILKHLYRPPWGEVAPTQLMRCIFGLDRLVLWSRDSMDYRDDAASIVADFRRRPPSPGDIILFHDDHAVAHEVLVTLIPEWRRLGFEFDPLPVTH